MGESRRESRGVSMGESRCESRRKSFTFVEAATKRARTRLVCGTSGR